jgi:predicted nucleic acid-binding protein
MLVIDSSALVRLLFGRGDVDAIARHIAAHGPRLHAPHLIDIEVLSLLARFDADDLVADFLSFPVRRYPHAILGRRIWELREHFSAYDAIYLALAENLADDGVPLLTADQRFAKAARKHTDVEVLLAA